MSKQLLSAVRGAVLGTVIGAAFGFATLATMGFDRITLFEGFLLASCAAFGGFLFGSLIGVTGAFRRESPEARAETVVAAKGMRATA